jgi:hypothetical protein
VGSTLVLGPPERVRCLSHARSVVLERWQWRTDPIDPEGALVRGMRRVVLQACPQCRTKGPLAALERAAGEGRGLFLHGACFVLRHLLDAGAPVPALQPLEGKDGGYIDGAHAALTLVEATSPAIKDERDLLYAALAPDRHGNSTRHWSFDLYGVR